MDHARHLAIVFCATIHTKEAMMDRPMEYELSPGEGLRIDFTDIWMLREIQEDGTVAVFQGPWGGQVVLRENHWHQAAPGLKLSIRPSPSANRITFLIDKYHPVILRHPPRDHHKPRPGRGTRS